MESYDVLEPDYFYHIFNRGNNREDLFREKDNYNHFLKLLKKHILPIADIYSYCLLKNHFHLLIKIKSLENLKALGAIKSFRKLSQPFSNLFNAYTKAINKRYNREGSLFKVRFKRKKIESEEYLRNTILYIHLNSEKHGLINNFENYKYSSYSSVLSKKTTSLSRDEVIELFDDIKNFVFIHRSKRNNLEFQILE